MKSAKLMLVVLAVCVVCVAGCEKKVALTIRNNSDLAREIQLSNPDQTVTVGVVGAGSVQRTTLKVKNSDLPAQCSITAVGGPTQTFLVDEDSPDAWWFHITKSGGIAGPYGKNDVHVESEQTIDVTTPVQQKTLVR